MKENIEYMQKLGLNEYQARTLVVLFSKREITAKKISEYSQIPHTRIYQVLESLQDKELIEHTPGKPRFYKALDPGRTINKLLRKHEKFVHKLRIELDKQLVQLKDTELVIVEPVNQKVHPALSVEQYKI